MKNIALIKCGHGYDPSIYAGKSYASSKNITTITHLQPRINTNLDEAQQENICGLLVFMWRQEDQMQPGWRVTPWVAY